ncbi:MAG TPA: deoxyribodipyrimidine photo-lyase, partial [Acidimicrobiales bacterium]
MARRVGVVWFRRDLRLADHPALDDALDRCQAVVCLFVVDAQLTGPSGGPRLAFLAECLADLDRSTGGNLVIRSGDPVDIVPAVAAEVAATGVWCTADFGPYGRRRDEAVGGALGTHSIAFHRVGSPYAVPPGTLTAASGRPFRVFTPFWRVWEAAMAGSDGTRLGRTSRRRTARLVDEQAVTVGSEPLPMPPATVARLPEAGEGAAQRVLDRFLRGPVDHYDDARDRPGVAGTSRLSPYLRFGCLHPRQVLRRLDGRRADHRRFATELCWREFYADVLFHHPATARQPYRNGWLGAATDTGPAAADRFRAWTEGRTGYPIVDAGMRQLAAEAWMHNRVRMIVASFLVKDLHLDWADGARWFMRQLVDGDLASNQHNWQWVAGTGTDPAPYFRIFNPVTQGRRFDPDGRYVRRWVPELAGLP